MIGRIKRSGGANINGIIEEYIAGGNISEGKFVKKISSGLATRTQIRASSNSKVGYIPISAANGNIVSKSSDDYTYITSFDSNYVSSYTYKLSEDNTFYSKVYPLKISGTIIVQLSNGSSNTRLMVRRSSSVTTSMSIDCDDAKVCSIDENNFILLYKYNNGIYGVLCTIGNDYTISFGTAVQILNTSVTFPDETNVVQVINNRAFFLYIDADKKIHGVLLNINGGISLLSDRILNEIVNTSNVLHASVEIIKNRIFVSHSDGWNILKGILCDISANDYAILDNVQISTTSNIGSSNASCYLLNKVFICSGCHKYLICDVENDRIVFGNTITLDNSSLYNSTVATAGDTSVILIGSSSYNTYYLYGQIFKVFDTITDFSSISDEIFGVSNTSASTGENIKIYVPEVVS